MNTEVDIYLVLQIKEGKTKYMNKKLMFVF